MGSAPRGVAKLGGQTSADGVKHIIRAATCVRTWRALAGDTCRLAATAGRGRHQPAGQLLAD